MRLARCAICALVVAITGYAQQTSDQVEGIRSLQFERVSHSRVQLTVHYQLSSPADIAIEYGPDPSLGFRTPTTRANPARRATRVAIGGLAPDRVYYFEPVLLRDGRKLTSWRCGETKSFESFDCQAVDEPAQFRTAAQPSEQPVKPIPPAQTDLPMPSISGQTFQVAVDGANRCTNFQEIITQAARADTSLNHEVIIPAGATCVGPFVAPPKSGAGTVVIRTSARDDRLPPDGSRISQSYLPVMATLATPPNLSKWEQVVFDFPDCTAGKRACSNGWRFVGIRFAPPPLEEFTPDVYKVVDVQSDQGRITVTVDRDLELANWTNVGMSGLRGAELLNRVQRPIVLSARQLSLGKAPAPEAYEAGSGFVVNAAFVPLEHCSGGKPIVCRTATPHGLEDPPTVEIERKQGGKVFASGQSFRGSRGGHAVRIEGSSLGDLNGSWGLVRAGFDHLVLRNPPRRDCDRNCGQATPISLIQIGGTGRIDGSHLYTVLSDTEIQLDYLDGEGQAFAGGFVTQDPQYRRSLVSFGTGNERLVLDRCIVDGGGFPLRYQSGMTIGSKDSAVFGSHFENLSSWRAINPASGQPDSGLAGYNLGHSEAIEFTDAERITVTNNTFLNCVGITLYAQPYRKTAKMTPSDVVISKNTFRIDDEYMAGDIKSNGRYHPMRHILELKRGVRFRFDGNTVDGGWADFTPTGPAITLYPIGAVRGNEVSDIEITNNTFRRISSGIQILAEHRAPGVEALPAARVRIANNLFEQIDFYAMRSQPSGVNGYEKSTNYGGYFLMLTGAMEDLTVTHNTVFDNRGRGPWTFNFRDGRSAGVTITDNIFTHNADGTFGGLSPPNQLGSILPLAKNTPFAAFSNYFTQTPDPDPSSSFARNLILPGVRDSSSPESYGSSSPQATFSRQDCENYYLGFEDITCVAGRTAIERFRSVFPVEGEFRYRDASIGAPGIDVDALEAAQGAVSGLDMRQDSSGATTLSYHTAAGESCVVDFSPDATFDEFVRAEDSGSGSERYVLLEGLKAGGEYHYRVQCSSRELRGSFVAGSTLRPTRSRAR